MNKLFKCLIPPISGLSVGFLCLNEAFKHSGSTHYTKNDLINNKELVRRIIRRHNTMKRFGVNMNN